MDKMQRPEEIKTRKWIGASSRAFLIEADQVASGIAESAGIRNLRRRWDRSDHLV
jgi:hypothetical protein